MKTKILRRSILLILVLPFFISACNEESEDVAFELQADAYVVKRKIDGETRFGTAFFAYGNKAIARATVDPPTGAADDSFELEATESSVYTFYKEPAAGDYSPTFPVQGQYLFDVESEDGETLLETDLLENGTLEIPVITETSYQANTESVTVKWETPENADGHVVKLLNDEGEVVFLSYTLIASADEYAVNQGSGNWDGTAYTGENYTLQVQAFTYEQGVVQDELLYNIKEISVAETQVTWGQ
jgi:hypothetical protein